MDLIKTLPLSRHIFDHVFKEYEEKKLQKLKSLPNNGLLLGVSFATKNLNNYLLNINVTAHLLWTLKENISLYRYSTGFFLHILQPPLFQVIKPALFDEGCSQRHIGRLAMGPNLF